MGPGEEPRRPMTAETGTGAAALPATAALPTAAARPTAALRPAAAALPAAEATIALVAVEDLGPFVSRQAAYDALRALPESDRVALEEAFFRGTSARGIAAMVGAPTSEAEAAIRTALVRFRNHIDAPAGVDSFDNLEAGTGTAG
jgi:DNA-directed RNA polymerase specialized sigma24 family protein